MSYPEDFLHICQDDFSGILRGKTLCHPTEKPIQDCKTGWIPSNALITFLGPLRHCQKWRWVIYNLFQLSKNQLTLKVRMG